MNLSQALAAKRDELAEIHAKRVVPTKSGDYTSLKSRLIRQASKDSFDAAVALLLPVVEAADKCEERFCGQYLIEDVGQARREMFAALSALREKLSGVNK